MKPITVYLDTSDFAVLYKVRPGDGLWPIRERLQQLSDTQDAVFPISYFQVFELLQRCEPAHLIDRFDRIKFMEQISNGWSFPFFEDLQDNSEARQYPQWFPMAAIANFDVDTLLLQLRKMLTQEPHLKKVFRNRTERRSLGSKTGFAKWIEEEPSALGTGFEVAGTALYGELFRSGLLRRYVLGNVSRHAANQELRSQALNLKSVYHWYFEKADNPNPVTDGLREVAEHWSVMLHVLSIQLGEARNQLDRLGAIKKRAAEYRKSEPHASQLANDIERKARLAKRGIKRWMQSPVSFQDNTLFGRSEIMEIQYRASMQAILDAAARGSTKVEQSMLADALHSLYLPYCTLWRGDQTFSRILREANVPNQHKIVPRLSDLPTRIDVELSNR